MPPRSVLTTQAEITVSQARSALAVYRGLSRATAALPARLGVPLSLVTPEELVLPRLVSIAEDFARAQLVIVTENTLRLRSKVEIGLWTKAEETVEASWEGLGRAWADWYSVFLPSAPRYHELQGYVEARNAILHGLGELTRKQMRGKSEARTRSRLGHCHIALSGRRLMLKRQDLEEAERVTVEFVVWLDKQLMSKKLIGIC